MNATWKALTAPYVAPNGYQVIPVTSEEQMESVGRSLHNGLTQGWAREKWADLCVQGRRQVLLIVNGEGTVSANSFLRTNPGRDGAEARFESLFVRGSGATVFSEGDPAFDAVSAYVDGLNSREIERLADVASDRIVQPEPVPQVDAAYAALVAMTPLERATRVAEDLGMSPIDALLAGHGALPEAPVADVARPRDELPALSWTPLSERFEASNGWAVVPAASSADIRRLGEELDNVLFHDSTAAQAAQQSVQGATRYAAIEDTDGVVRGFAQFGCVSGQPILTAARGYCDAPLSSQALEALGRGPDGKPVMGGYLPALYTGGVALLAGLGPNGFAETPVDFNAALEGATGRVGSAPLTRILGAGPDAGATGEGGFREGDGNDDETGFDDGGYDDEDGFDDAGPFDDEGVPAAPVATEWQGITAGWTEAATGLRVVPAESAETLARMGNDFGNALANPGYREGIQRQCADGRSQVIQVMSGDTMVANGMVEVRDGEVRFLSNPMGEGDFLFGPGGSASLAKGNLTPNARAAADAWVKGVNEGTIELRGQITERGFQFAAPEAAPDAPHM